MNADGSRTAEYVALFRALESAEVPSRRLFEDPQATRFLRPSLRAVAYAARVPALRSQIVRFIDHRWPGPRLSAVVRTRVIDDFVLGAVGETRPQLVLLGAGYDTRATRLPALASRTVFEVDHPATQARKRRAMGGLGGGVHYVPVDFERDDLVGALTAAGFDREQPSCVVWEGVFSYLTPDAIDVTLASLRELCAPGSEILLTYIDQRALEPAAEQPQAWLTAVSDVGEPFRTGLDPHQAAAFFAERGLRLSEDESTTAAARRLGVVGAETIPDVYRVVTLSGRPVSRSAQRARR
jgi:methyltransferase (TIGR00027 family)